MQGHSNLTDHHCGRWLQLSRDMITFDAALPTSKLEAVEPDSGSTCCAIETSVCTQRAISESDHCSLMLGAAPAPHTESLSALQTSTLSFTVHSVESQWSAPSLS